jgi:hypothetical protein
MLKKRWKCLAVVLAWTAMSWPVRAAPRELPKESPSAVAVITKIATRCKEIANFDFSDVRDAPTQLVSATPVTATDDVPEHCQLEGYVAPNVGFRIGLPSKWNGKFLEMGCGGQCGMFYWGECSRPLQRGYACVVSNMGHTGSWLDSLWGYDNVAGKLDWGYRATHVVALAGKAITERYYAKNAKRSYFMGCSTGGRQALQEAQRFPWDFDGIVAGSPPINLATLYMSWAWEFVSSHDRSGKPLLGKEELKLVTTEAAAQCNVDNAIRDGVIGDPLQCAFDPSKLRCRVGQSTRCLKPDQIEVLNKLYSGPRTSQGMRLTPGGILPGSEYANAETLTATHAPALLTGGLRYLFFWPEQDSKWEVSDFDFDRDYKRLGVMEFLYDSSNPDLRQFKAAGGKLIAYQGLNDHMARAVLDYYDTVERTMGGLPSTQDFFRLFVQPGSGHCGLSDETVDWADYLGALEAWVEDDHSPEQIISSRVRLDDLRWDNPHDVPGLERRVYLQPDPSTVESTRPSYPYPTRAKYLGHGDPKDAASFGPQP